MYSGAPFLALGTIKLHFRYALIQNCHFPDPHTQQTAIFETSYTKYDVFKTPIYKK